MVVVNLVAVIKCEPLTSRNSIVAVEGVISAHHELAYIAQHSRIQCYIDHGDASQSGIFMYRPYR